MSVARKLSDWAKEHQQFHEHGTLFGIWLLVVFVGVGIFANARSILEPILWAFFLVMGLVPVADALERWLFLAISCVAADGDLNIISRSRTSSEGTSQVSRDSTCSYRTIRAVRSSSDEEAPPATDTESDKSEETRSGEYSGIARSIAVILVLCLTMVCGFLFFVVVYRSALHMQHDWPYYSRGAQKFSQRLEGWSKHIPDGVIEQYTNKIVAYTESALFDFVNFALSATSHACLEMVWILLYMVFWLCQPVHITKDVSAVFQTYIFLKGVASAGYAVCIWLLLHVIGVDMASIFGLITFFLNFIPEIGPFIAMLLPLPAVLFDDRIGSPLQCVVLALCGQMLLKVIFGNIVEIKLIERQQEMKMHPVVILFFVAFFQFIWGPTGMLLSVPIVAALKATLHKIPPAYRDPILVFLEGDKAAPGKWLAWREKVPHDPESSED